MKPLLAAFLVFMLLLWFPALMRTAPIPETNLSVALAKAKQEHKLLFVQYGSTTCGYCRMLRTMLNSGRLELSDADFVYLDLLTEDPRNIKAFDEYFRRGIGLPFVAIIAPDGKEIGSHMGADEQPLKALVAKGQAYLAVWKNAN